MKCDQQQIMLTQSWIQGQKMKLLWMLKGHGCWDRLRNEGKSKYLQILGFMKTFSGINSGETGT